MPMSDSNFNKYPCSLSLKVLDRYYLIPLEKETMTESVVFFRKLAVLNVLAFYLVNVFSPKMSRIVGEPHGQKANIKKSRGSEGVQKV